MSNWYYIGRHFVFACGWSMLVALVQSAIMWSVLLWVFFKLKYVMLTSCGAPAGRMRGTAGLQGVKWGCQGEVRGTVEGGERGGEENVFGLMVRQWMRGCGGSCGTTTAAAAAAGADDSCWGPLTCLTNHGFARARLCTMLHKSTGSSCRVFPVLHDSRCILIQSRIICLGLSPQLFSPLPLLPIFTPFLHHPLRLRSKFDSSCKWLNELENPVFKRRASERRRIQVLFISLLKF